MNKEEINNMYKVLKEQWGDSDNYINDLLNYSEDLQQENKQLKEQLEYIRSGEYYNQLRFERDMLQDLVGKGEISKEDKEFIDCTHRNTQLLERIDKTIEIAKEKIKKYESYLNDLKNGNYPSPIIRRERQELKFRIKEQEELLETLKGENND